VSTITKKLKESGKILNCESDTCVYLMCVIFFIIMNTIFSTDNEG